MVSTPARAQAASNHPGAPTNLADSADVIKMPETIIDPTTIIVASSGIRRRNSLTESFGVSLIVSDGYSVMMRDCQEKIRMRKERWSKKGLKSTQERRTGSYTLI